MCEADYDQGSKSVAVLCLNCRKERFVRLPQEKLQKIFGIFLDAILPALVGDPLLKADFLRHLQLGLEYWQGEGSLPRQRRESGGRRNALIWHDRGLDRRGPLAIAP